MLNALPDNHVLEKSSSLHTKILPKMLMDMAQRYINTSLRIRKVKRYGRMVKMLLTFFGIVRAWICLKS